MSRNPLLIDAVIALVAAILIIVISPGLAVVGLLALVVLLLCALSFGLDRLRRRRRGDPVAELRRSGSAEPPRPRRSPPAGARPARRSPPRRPRRR